MNSLVLKWQLPEIPVQLYSSNICVEATNKLAIHHNKTNIVNNNQCTYSITKAISIKECYILHYIRTGYIPTSCSSCELR